MDTSEEQRGSVRFDGRVAVVTGVGAPVPARTARLLAERGAAVVTVDTTAHGQARRVADVIVASGGRAEAVGGRVDAPESIAAAAVAVATAAYGRLDVVVTGDAGPEGGPFAELTTEDLWAAWNGGVGASFALARAAWPHLVASGRGKIVDITSAVGMFAVDGATPCADMASGARVGLVRSLAAEGAAGGIGVNGVLIGGADPDVAAAAATWLAHADCPDTSRFLLVGADISEGFGCAAHGYQSPRPARFDLEEIRDNWAEVKIRTGSLAPATIADYGAFRMGIYSETVTEAVS